MFELTRPNVPHQPRPAPIRVVPDDREPAVLVPREHERLELVPQALDGVVLLEMDRLDLAVGLSIVILRILMKSK